ncbi:hypothetical protein [Halobellus ordinarius]|nr:hypothetical protein [Halobellus sp. ZY16]
MSGHEHDAGRPTGPAERREPPTVRTARPTHAVQVRTGAVTEASMR